MLFGKPETLEPEDILDWHGLCTSGLRQERRDAKSSISLGRVLPAYLKKALRLGATPEDVDHHFDSCQLELDLSAVLAMIAGAEARIRLDACCRVQTSCTNSNRLAGRLSVLRGKVATDWAVPLYESGIMDAWKDYVGSLATMSKAEKDRIRGAIGELKTVLDIRHWVAHGRYWQLKRDVNCYPPVTVARTIIALYAAMRDVAVRSGVKVFV